MEKGKQKQDRLENGPVRESGAAEAAPQIETDKLPDIFLTEIRIQHVRHLRDIVIPLSETERKNLILTGENGSGKSSVLEALGESLDLSQGIVFDMPQIDYHRKYLGEDMRVNVKWSVPLEIVRQSTFVSVMLDDDRELGDEKKSNPALDLDSVLLLMAKAQREYAEEGDQEGVNEVEAFFQRFQEILQKLFGGSSLKLRYHPETKRRKPHFTILMEGREEFDFATLARGYSAALEPIGVLLGMTIMTMDKDGGELRFDFRRQCVALIDEIDAHLHVGLQKKILPMLTELFPKVQFIVTTHSPFVLASAANAVVYDLEHRVLAADGLSNVPYSGIVEGYFQIGEMSDKLERELREYRALAAKKEWTDRDCADAARLEMDLDSVPDFLAGAWKAEYSRLKLEIAADKGE